MGLNRKYQRVAQVLNLGGFAARGRWGLENLDLVKTSWDFVPPVQEPVLPASCSRSPIEVTARDNLRLPTFIDRPLYRPPTPHAIKNGGVCEALCR